MSQRAIPAKSASEILAFLAFFGTGSSCAVIASTTFRFSHCSLPKLNANRALLYNPRLTRANIGTELATIWKVNTVGNWAKIDMIRPSRGMKDGGDGMMRFSWVGNEDERKFRIVTMDI